MLKMVLQFSIFMGFLALTACKVGGEPGQEYIPVGLSDMQPKSSFSEGNIEVVLKGTEFSSDMKVFIGNKRCKNFQYHSLKKVSCSVPALAPGKHKIRFKDFRDTEIEGMKFEVYDHLEVSSVDMATVFTGGEDRITLTGKGFQAETEVKVDGLDCTNIVINSIYSLSCDTPEHAEGVVDLVLSNPSLSETVTLSQQLEYKVDAFTSVKLVEGGFQKSGFTDGSGPNGKFNYPFGIATDGKDLYIADTVNSVIKIVDLKTNTSTLFAGAINQKGNTNGALADARFYAPTGLLYHNKKLYISDTDSCKIRVIDLQTETVSKLAGTGCGADTTEATKDKFFSPYGLATDGTYLYVADSKNYRVKRVHMVDGTVDRLAGKGNAGSYDQGQYKDGCGNFHPVDNPGGAKFGAMMGLSLVGNYLYIADSNMHTIRRMNINDNCVDYIAGGYHGQLTVNYNQIDNVDGTLAKFNKPGGMVSDGNYLYVSDSLNDVVRRVDLSGTNEVVSLAGIRGGTKDGVGIAATMKRPGGITKVGNKLYFVDIGNHSVRSLDLSNNEVKTIVGHGAQ